MAEQQTDGESVDIRELADAGDAPAREAAEPSRNSENYARPTPDLSKVLKAATEFRTVGSDPYAESLRKLREVVWRKLPLGACVLVVSKGDKRLLSLYGPRASHFPQKADGSYLGHYPPDGTAVISHLEALRSQGAEYLIFPKSALWWLESYPRLASHLRLHYRLVVHDPSACAIFALKQAAALDRSIWRAALLRVVEERAAERGVEPAVLDWNTGLDLKRVLANRAVFSPPTPDSVPRYLDRSIDIVVLLSPDEEALAEARRVAGHAVVVLDLSTGESGAGGIGGPGDELRIEIEHVDRRITRTTPSTSIVIQAHNGWEQLGRCLASLEETLPDPFDGEVVVVDDAAGDETNTVLHEWERLESRLRLRIVQNSDSRGLLESCNRGAAEASCEVIVFLNERTLPQFGWLSSLHSIFTSDDATGAVTGRVLYPDGRLWDAGNVVYSDGSTASIGFGEYGPDDPLYTYVREVDFCSPVLFATRRKVFEEIGGFSGPPGYENIDYCFALRARGYKVKYQPECAAIHFESSADDHELTDGTAKYQEANRAKFIEKWAEALEQQREAPGKAGVRPTIRAATERWVGQSCAPRCSRSSIARAAPGGSTA